MVAQIDSRTITLDSRTITVLITEVYSRSKKPLPTVSIGASVNTSCFQWLQIKHGLFLSRVKCNLLK